MPLSLTTAPTVEPVTVGEFKEILGYGDNDQDTYFEHLVKAARLQCESMTWRQFVNATYTATFAYWREPLELPRPPIVSVTSVKYYDTTNTQQTWASSNYRVKTGSPGHIEAVSTSIPAVYNRWDAIEVIYTCGYGTSGHDVPEPIRMAIGFLARHWYECGCEGSVPTTVRGMLAPYMMNTARTSEVFA